MQPLPIDHVVGEIVAKLRSAGSVVVEAPPGAGKTTRVPPALLDAGLAGRREVLVLQPRRLATRLAARRVAQERGEPLGHSVGYRIRFESVGGAETRLRYVTEGVLSRMLATDPTLDRIGLVVLDEFHERHVHGDLALALCRRLQLGPRPDLRLAVMSATLDAEPITRFLGDCPRVRSEGRRYEVALEHLDRPDRRPLSAQVVSALRRLITTERTGDVLVFLPGAAEIRQTRAACAELAAEADLELLTLHGSLPSAEQDRALAPCPRRKVILSTNVAETSLTIDGVVAVIDGGLARIAGHAPWSGLPTLRVAPISRAAAAQRMGRAGRTQPGRCLRLYTRGDHDRRPAAEQPEIARIDLAETVLTLRGHGIQDPSALDWLDPPPPTALAAADELLAALGALAPDGSLAPLGRRLLRIPAHPRIARLLVEAEQRGVVAEASLHAALLSERDIMRRPAPGGRGAPRDLPTPATSDLAIRAELFHQAATLGDSKAILGELGLDRGALRAVDRTQRQLARLVARGGGGRAEGQRRELDPTELDEAIRLCLLAGFPDRLARRVRQGELSLAGGGRAALSAQSAVTTASFVVALDAEQRQDEGRAARVQVHRAAAIEPEWLIELFPEQVEELTDVRWNESRERVEISERLLYRSLVVHEQSSSSAGAEQAAEVLAQAALACGPAAFAPADALGGWLHRLGFARSSAPDAELPAIDESTAAELLRELCADRRSFAELREARLLDLLQARLSPGQRRDLGELAPEHVHLPSGRRLRIHYERDLPPWVESRLQDFFGMTASPTVARGRVALVLHLLAPNGRPAQITSDLPGFWEGSYAAVRKELRGRYPKHDWPLDGRTATPPKPGRTRRR